MRFACLQAWDHEYLFGYGERSGIDVSARHAEALLAVAGAVGSWAGSLETIVEHADQPTTYSAVS